MPLSAEEVQASPALFFLSVEVKFSSGFTDGKRPVLHGDGEERNY